MALHYRVYGLTLEANEPIDGLIPLSGTPASPDLRIHYRVAPLRPDDLAVVHEGELDPESQTANVIIRRSASTRVCTIDYRDGTSFVIAPGGSEVWCDWPSTSTPEDTATYLLGPVLAYVLRLRGTLALHASGIAIADRALLLAGAPRAGKSTTAAAFAKRGAEVITDDVSPLILEDPVRVLPGYPRLRLWSDSAEALVGELPRLTPNWEKRYLSVDVTDTPREIGAVAVLAGRAAATSIRQLYGHAAAITLLRYASMTHALDESMRAREFAQVTKLANRIPVFEVVAADALDRVDALCDALSALSSPA
ncbi:MAG TPA: hypothetical protein VFN10_04045 [Thermoanaerobaculia bacterium]|nr:hypothetical protein [Thermoanaerobaculia bacterium]